MPDLCKNAMLDLILSWVADLLAAGIDALINLIMPVFGFDFQTFANAFPFAATAYMIFQRIALAIVLLIGVWHLLPFLMSWFGIRAEHLRSTPTRQMGQVVLAVIVIYYGNYVLEAIINIAQMPFEALLNASAGTNVALNVFSFADIDSVISDAFYSQSIFVYCIMICMIGWQLLLLILEAVERYIVLYILVYVSPLASASLASEETSGIFSRFFAMFISQCLLLLLNVWSLKMAVSMLGNLENNDTMILGLLMGYGLLRVARHLDSYMNQLGLNAAITGAGLGNELFATGALMMGTMSRWLGGGGRTASSDKTGGGGVLGYSKALSNAYGKFSPVGALADTGRAVLSGAAKTVKDGVISAYTNTVGGGSTDYGSGTPTTGTNSPGGRSGKVAAAIKKHQTGDANPNTGASPETQENASIRTKATAAWYHFKQSDLGKNISTSTQGVDNIYTRAGYAKTNEAAIFNSAAQGTDQNGGMTEEQRSLISNNPYSAAKMFHTYSKHPDMSTSDAQTVTAVMEGIGVGKADSEVGEFMNVGYGNQKTPAKNISFDMNSAGIQASYIQDGRQHNLNMVNADQYSRMSHEEQTGYKQFKASAGGTFYYRTSSQKVESTGGRNIRD